MGFERVKRAAAAGLLCSLIPVAHADLGSAFKAYDARQYDKAYVEFHALAELGSPLAQLNTGLMLINGDGVKKDPGTGFGWVLAARDNGSGAAAEYVKGLQGAFTPEQKAQAESHVGQFGKTGIRERLYPQARDAALVARIQPVREREPLRVLLPDQARAEGTFGFVETILIMGRDGRLHDVWISAALPEDVYEAPALSALRRWHLEPATLDGAATTVASTLRVSFGVGAGDASHVPRLVKFISERRQAAKEGKAIVQYQLGRLLAGLPALQADEGEALRWLDEAVRKGYPPAQQFLGLCILSGDPVCRGAQGDGLELIVRAAQSGDAPAQLLMAIMNLSQGDAAGRERAARWLDPAVRGGELQPSKYLAAVRAAAPEAGLRDARRAHDLLAPFLKQANAARDPDVWQIEAAAFATQGDFSAAADAQRRAITRAETLKWNLGDLQARLKAYESGNAWHGDLLGLAGMQWVPDLLSSSLKPEWCEETPEAGSRITKCETVLRERERE